MVYDQTLLAPEDLAAKYTSDSRAMYACGFPRVTLPVPLPSNVSLERASNTINPD